MTLQKNTIQKALAVVLGLAAFAALLILTWNPVHGALSKDDPAIVNQFRVYDLFASTTAETKLATSTSATSTNITAYQSATTGQVVDGSVDARGAKRAQVFFTRGDAFGNGNTGTSTFALQGSVDDGVTWHYIANFSTTTEPTVTTMTRIRNGPYFTFGQTSTGNAATSTFVYALTLTADNWQRLRCVATRQTDGSNQCQIALTY